MTPWLARRWYDAVFWFSFVTFSLGWSLRVIGRRNMPKSGPVLLLANHQSFFDPVLVGLASRRYLSYLARVSLFRNPFFDRLIRSLDAIPIDNQGFARDGLKATWEMLDRGKAILLFPEGERTEDGKMLPFKPGVSLLLKKAKVPIVPVGIAGAFAAWPRWKKLPTPSPLFQPADAGTIAISVGKPVDPHLLDSMTRDEQLAFLFQQVQNEFQKADQLRRKP